MFGFMRHVLMNEDWMISEVRKWTVGTLNAPWKNLIHLDCVDSKFSVIY